MESLRSYEGIFCCQDVYGMTHERLKNGWRIGFL